MKQLTCEMCGGTDLVKQEGVFVCNSCSTKYSVEEAKKMMVEGTVEVAGTVKVDETAKIANFLKIAETAISTSNNAEAEKYCNQILEIDPKDCNAWVLKGKAAGWQSNMRNDRSVEAAKCFLSALEYAPDGGARDIVIKTCTELKNLSYAIIKLYGDHFGSFPGSDTATTLLNKTTEMIKLAKIYTANESVKAFAELDVESATSKLDGSKDATENAAAEIKKQVEASLAIKWLKNIGGGLANVLNQAVVKGYKKAMADYLGDTEKPSDYDLSNFIKEGDVCRQVLNGAILIEDSTKDKIQYYKNMITMSTDIRDAKSWERDFSDRFTAVIGKDGNKYIPSKTLDAAAIRNRSEQIAKYQKTLEDLEAKLKEEGIAAIAAYWEKHKEEKNALESEKSDLAEKIAQLKSAIDALPQKQELRRITDEIAGASAEKDSLGAFKNKEKKALQERIDNLSRDKSAAEAEFRKAAASMEKEISDHNGRIAEIGKELTKER